MYSVLSPVNVVKVLHVDVRYLLPPLRLYQIHKSSADPSSLTVVVATAHSVAMRRVVDGSLSQVNRLLVYASHSPSTPTRHVIVVQLVEDAVGIGAARTHREVASVLVRLQSRSVVVHVVDLRPGLVPAANHRANTETVILVVV